MVSQKNMGNPESPSYHGFHQFEWSIHGWSKGVPWPISAEIQALGGWGNLPSIRARREVEDFRSISIVAG